MEVSVIVIMGLGFFAGLLIGAAGIGGVILVPSLIYFAEVPIHSAITGASMSFILTGVIGTFLYARAGSIRWDMAAWLSAGAAPGALAGAHTSQVASGALLEIAIGLLTALAGLHSLFLRRDREVCNAASMHPWTLAAVGAVTGFASALTGTGGPLVLIPLLMAIGRPVLAAVGLAQVIQLPVSLFATAGNFHSGILDPRIGGLLLLGVPLGSWAGSKIAHTLPGPALRRVVSILLVSTGALMIGKIAARFVM